MEIDEAIRHAEEVAKENESLGAMGRGNPDKYAPSIEQCFKCAEEHRQLVAWLKELKELREQKRPHGEWIKKYDEKTQYYTCTCSVCGDMHRLPINYFLESNFCPKCGSDNRKKASK